jgi:cytochrome c oxidase cbb3-type subunit III
MTSHSALCLAACLAASLPIAAQAPAPAPLKRATAADLKGGASVYSTYCARCHGIDGAGGVGPPLARPRLRRAQDEAAIIGILVDGIPGTAMMAAWSLSEREMRQVAAYVRSLGRRPPERLPGDPPKGKGVYTRLGCATCHIIDGEGAGIGRFSIRLPRGRSARCPTSRTPFRPTSWCGRSRTTAPRSSACG